MDVGAAPKPQKPLGRKSYGSIPHLPGSRVGPGDWHIGEGQARIACEARRHWDDRVICTEKLDGSNVGIARIGYEIVPLTRAGYHARDSHFEQHRHFARWVENRRQKFRDMLMDGQRAAGEWLLQAHGVRYDIESAEDLFVAFDLLTGKDRASHDELTRRCQGHGVKTAAVISDGPPISVEEALARLGDRGFHGGLDMAEGAVWRVEHRGKFDFITKFVRHDKKDGWLLPEISGGAPVWNWDPNELR